MGVPLNVNVGWQKTGMTNTVLLGKRVLNK